MYKKYLSRKDRIIISAIDIIDELGIDGLSIRELAKKQNVSEAALYRHFKSKNDIIIEVLNYYSHFDSQRIETTIKNLHTSKSAILFFASSYAEYYENYPEITAISCSYESLIYDPIFKNEIMKICGRKLDFLNKVIELGKNNGEFPKEFNREDLAEIIMGSLRFIVFKWRTEKYSFSLKEKTIDTLNLILR